MIAIVDCGGTNITSIRRAFERLGATTTLTRSPEKIRSASRVVLPGVGAAGVAMRSLQQDALADVLRALTQPVIGFCLGMQILFEASAEDDAELLGVLPGRVEAMTPTPDVCVPHMGWNDVSLERPHPIFDGVPTGASFFFAHSYCAPLSDATIGMTEHGTEFSSIVGRGNVLGCQFHPERSGAAGERLLQNFLGWQP